MKKIWIFSFFIVFVAAVVWLFSRRIDTQHFSDVTAPQLLEVSNNTSHFSTSDLKGKYVLVNFWDSHNAVSRIAAGEYDRYYRTHRNKNLRLLSINTDDNHKLFDEIVRRDGLDSLTQFHIDNVKARGVSSGYHPEAGYSSYLLNPSGKVIAVNPTVETVNQIIDTKTK